VPGPESFDGVKVRLLFNDGLMRIEFQSNGIDLNES
jgi:hypothetical protein